MSALATQSLNVMARQADILQHMVVESVQHGVGVTRFTTWAAIKEGG
jgi:hypothetical protein